MIAKQIKGSSFYGVLKYMDEKVKKDVGKLLHTNMYGQKPVKLNKEFELVQSLKPTISKAVYHVSLNLIPGESLEDCQFIEIAEKYLDKMGFNNNQFVVYRHYDREHSHIHIIANRIKYDGEVVSDSQDYKRSEKIIRSIEKDYNLQLVEESQKSERKALSKGMVEFARKTGEAPLKLQLQEIIDKAIEGKPNIEEFEERLVENGVGTRFYTNSKGLYGMSFTIDGFSFKASSLGKKYQFKNFKNLIDYDNKRDIKTISKKGYRGTRENPKATSGKSLFSEHGEHRGYERSSSTDSNITKANDFIDGRRQQSDIPDSKSIASDIAASWKSDRGAKVNSTENSKDKEGHFYQDFANINANRERSRKPNLPNIAMDAMTPKKPVDSEEEERIIRKKRQRNL